MVARADAKFSGIPALIRAPESGGAAVAAVPVRAAPRGQLFRAQHHARKDPGEPFQALRIRGWVDLRHLQLF